MVFSIIIIFSMSSVAYVITSFTQPYQGNDDSIDSFVIDGELSPEQEQLALQNRFTIVKYYYSSPELMSFIEKIPDNFKTNVNQVQAIVEKIPTNGTSYVYIVGPFNDVEIEELTQDNIYNALCDTLASPPLECGLRNLT